MKLNRSVALATVASIGSFLGFVSQANAQGEEGVLENAGGCRHSYTVYTYPVQYKKVEVDCPSNPISPDPCKCDFENHIPFPGGTDAYVECQGATTTERNVSIYTIPSGINYATTGCTKIT